MQTGQCYKAAEDRSEAAPEFWSYLKASVGCNSVDHVLEIYAAERNSTVAYRRRGAFDTVEYFLDGVRRAGR
jgi:hypothetical protein